MKFSSICGTTSECNILVLKNSRVLNNRVVAKARLYNQIAFKTDFARLSVPRFRIFNDTVLFHTFSIEKSHSSAPRAEAVEFKARKSLNLPCKEVEPSVEKYLADTERIVHVAFPDSKRLEYLGDEVWRARLKPVTFFTVSATPVSDLRAWSENGSLKIFSDKVVLDLSGLPPQFHNIDLRLRLEGKLQSRKQKVTRPQEANCRLEGWVNMGLKLDLPIPFSFMPKQIVRGVGDAILDGILTAMQNALMRGLVQDYLKWAREKRLQKGSDVSFQPTVVTRSLREK